MANSKVDALEIKKSTLRKELIMAMDNGNRLKEQVKALSNDLKAEKLLTEQKYEQLWAAKCEASVARDDAVQAFQLTDKYNGILLSWYFKGLELLRRYLAKHNPGVDLDNLDFEVVDKEMEDEEANATGDAIPVDEEVVDGDDPAT